MPPITPRRPTTTEPHHPSSSDRRGPGPLVAIALTVCVAGCASPVPEVIRDSGSTTPITVSQAQADPARHTGQRVRWGGEILSVSNLERATEIEILSRRLGREGAPVADAELEGRFIARVPGFVDPARLPVGRDITLVGMIEGGVTRPVGEFPYVYPMLATESRYLWPEPLPASAYAYPSPWFGPWYDPFWGPYWGPHWGPMRRHGGGLWVR